MADYQMRARVARALSHPVRLEIVDLLAEQEEICVCELVEMVSQSQSSVSKHLNVLREAGILSSRREGLKIFYRLRARCVHGFLCCLDQLPPPGAGEDTE